MLPESGLRRNDGTGIKQRFIGLYSHDIIDKKEPPMERPQPLLIETKLHQPQTPHSTVERSRLFDRLDELRRCRTVLISAGAGFGKSTLAAQWLEHRSVRHAWPSLDSLDNDPERFSKYFVSALQKVLPDSLNRTAALLGARMRPSWSYFVETLVSELSQPAEPSVVVLDDYHLVANKEVDTLLERVVENLPDSLRLIILTRADPPWPLGRWRARGWLSELRDRDLRFSLDETRSFFDAGTRLHLDDETVRILHQETEGWVAGLRLAGLSLEEADRPDRRARQLSGSDRHIAAFLVSEVLDVQPPEVREFMAVAALLEQFCAPLCDHVLSGPHRCANTHEILARLASRNLFLVPLDEQRVWYRFHHIFREFLLQRVDELVSAELRARVDQRAGEWFAGKGLVEEALRHWVAAGQLDAAAALVGEHLESAVKQDPSRRFLYRWLAIFPPGAEHGRIALLIAHAYQRVFRWDLAGLAAVLAEAERLPAAGQPPYRVVIEGHKAFLAYWQGDAESALRHARIALDERAEVGYMPWVTANLYAAAALSAHGRKDEALLLDEAIAESARHRHYPCELVVAQAFIHLYAQELDAARPCALNLVAGHKHSPIPRFWLEHAHHVLGMVAYERNHLDEAADWFGRVEASRYLVISRVYHDALIGQALVANATGDITALNAYADKARAWAVEVGDPTSLRISSSFELRLAISGRWAAPALQDPPAADDHHSAWLEVPSLTWAEWLVTNASPEMRKGARPFIEDAIVRMERHHNLRQATVLSLLCAMALDAEHRRDDALAVLAETLHRAAPHGLVRTFVDRGTRLQDLLDELSRRQGSSDAYRDMLRAAFLEQRTSVRRMAVTGDRYPGQLSYRELDVLELLVEGLSNKEIAARLS